MSNKSGEGFLLTTKLYKSAYNAILLVPDKWKSEGKAYIQPEGKVITKHKNTTTKQIVMQKIYARNLHVKLGHTR